MVQFLYSPGGDSPLRFEFDPAKSEANKAKHGIDFVEAQELWRDRRTVTTPSGYRDEERYEVVGRIAGRYWTAVVTMRGGAVRIISVRRSRACEVRRSEEA